MTERAHWLCVVTDGGDCWGTIQDSPCRADIEGDGCEFLCPLEDMHFMSHWHASRAGYALAISIIRDHALGATIRDATGNVLHVEATPRHD